MDVKTYKQLDSKIDCQTDRHLDGQMDEWLKQNISVQMCLCNGHGGQIERNHTRKSTVRWTDGHKYKNTVYSRTARYP